MMNMPSTSTKCAQNMCDPECADSSRTLGIIHEFRKLYEDKMRIIEAEGSGDCNIKAKLSLQHDWIRDLNEQNEMLVRAVEELEQEATERVIALEEKLRQSSKCACEHVDALQEDVCTLVAFIKRSIMQRSWDLDSLSLRTVRIFDITPDVFPQTPIMENETKMQHEIALKDKNIKMLQQKLEDAMNAKMLMAAEMQKECNKCDELQKSMLDIRDALAAEVADKHDVILTLKRDVQVLEEQCKKADQQTHFKDDIIKELRKEIKLLKSEISAYTNAESPMNTLSSKSMESITDSSVFRSSFTNKHYKCPIREHINIERYKDLKNSIVIFVCEDVRHKEIYKMYDGHKLKVDYHNRRIVHEYDAAKLRKIFSDEDFTSSLKSIPSMHDEDIVSLKKITTERNSIIENGTFSELVHSHPAIKNRKMSIITYVVDNLPSSTLYFNLKQLKCAANDARSFLFCKDN